MKTGKVNPAGFMEEGKEMTDSVILEIFSDYI
jgi:hypothetical protein